LLYYPDSFDPDDPRPHPTIVWTHGGPMSYDDPEFSFDYAFFTSRGYLVCKPNYRGSTSYGREHAEALHGRWNSVEVEDVLAVTDDLVDRGVADPDRLFATGFSYGGILTGYLITATDRFAAAAAEHGIYDLRAEFGTSDSQAWMASEFGLPWEAPEAYAASSSITDVDRVETPTLVTAGSEDWRCPPTQAEQLYVSLRKRDVPARLVLYPGERHDVGEPERAIHRLEELVGWFERFDPTVAEASD
ncbi:MAG: alpha/beta hydrolase family protein, partial [Halobacteriota archaeon]